MVKQDKPEHGLFKADVFLSSEALTTEAFQTIPKITWAQNQRKRKDLTQRATNINANVHITQFYSGKASKTVICKVIDKNRKISK